MSAKKRRGRPTVGPVDRAVLGGPEPCPACGGRLALAFGQTVGDDGIRRPFVDPTSAMCRDCGALFTVKAKPEHVFRQEDAAMMHMGRTVDAEGVIRELVTRVKRGTRRHS